MKRYPFSAIRQSWHDHAGAHSVRPGKQICLPPTRVLAVDPATTSPNVFVGVSTSPDEDPRYLRPGEFITFDKPQRQFWIYNPTPNMIAKTLTLPLNGTGVRIPMTGVLNGVLGTMSLLASEDPRAVESLRANPTRPLPSAAVIGMSPITATDPSVGDVTDSLFVPVAGLEHLRLRLVCLGALDALIAAPADLAGTIRVWTRARLPLTGPGADLNYGAISNVTVDEGGWPEYGGATFAAWQCDSTIDVAINNTRLAIEYDVLGEDMVLFQVIGLAGAGVTGILGIVEGR